MRLTLHPFAPVVPVIRLQGLIGSRSRASGLSDAALAPLLERAFSHRRARAVALVINSPGGSPVQSSLIAARIRRLAERRKLPVHAFVEDTAASGGYWLATAADSIWLDHSSVVGSIGVISAGFGFTGLIARLGIDRRVHATGRDKGMLDPFQPEDPADVARLHRLMAPMMDAFRTQVRDRRGARLDETADLFTGDVWVGTQAISVGLADGIAHLEPKLRALYGERVVLQPYGLRRPWLSRMGLSADSMIDSASEHAARAQLGLKD